MVDTNSTSHTRLPGAANHSANLPDALELLRRRLKLDLHPDDSRLLVVISDSAPANLEHVERTLPDTFNDILAALIAGGYQDRAQPR